MMNDVIAMKNILESVSSCLIRTDQSLTVELVIVFLLNKIVFRC